MTTAKATPEIYEIERVETNISARVARPHVRIFHFDIVDRRPPGNNDVKWQNLKFCGGRHHTTLKGDLYSESLNRFKPLKCLDN